MGHSTGGLLAQIIADRGLSAATVAIDPGPVPRRAAAADLGAEVGQPGAEEPAQPRPRHHPDPRSVQVRLGERARATRRRSELYETYHVAAPGVALMQMANANLNPFTEAKVDPKNPDRGPLLIIDGEKDHTVPWAIANASYKRQKPQPGRDRDREDPEPRPLADHRQRLARGRPDGAGLREAVHLGGRCPRGPSETSRHAARLPAQMRGRQPLLWLDDRPRPAPGRPRRGHGQPLHAQPAAGGAGGGDPGRRSIGRLAEEARIKRLPRAAKLRLAGLTVGAREQR